MLLSDADLERMRTFQEGAMPDTCTLRTVTLTSDGSGGWTEGTEDTANVPCRLMQVSNARGIEDVNAGRVVPTRSYMLTVPITYTLTPQMRVVKDGATFEITSVNQSLSWSTARRAFVERVET